MTNMSARLAQRYDELGADSPGGTLVVLIGERGSGRTTLLRGAGVEARASGRMVLYVDLGGNRADWDEYGVGLLLDAVSAQFEDLGGTAELMRSISALYNRCTPLSYRTATGRMALYRDVQRLLDRLGPDAALVSLDNVDLVQSPESLAVAAREAGHRVIAAAGPASALCNVADTLVRVKPIVGDDVEQLLRRALRVRPDPLLVETLRRALGPFAGNAAHILALLDQLRRTDRLVTVARHTCLRQPWRTPALPSDAPAMAAVAELGEFAEDLVLLVDGPVRIRVDEMPMVAAALGRSARETGGAADRLVEQGILEDRQGELVVRCPAVGAALRERAGAGRVKALHASVALVATDPAHAGLVPLGRDVLADHVAAAGDGLAADPRWGVLLRGRARDNQRHRPERAARFLLAAWNHDAAGHRPAGTAEWTLRLLLRVGEHDGVARVVADVVAAGGHEADGSDGVDRRLLAASASVAALTCRRRVPAAVHAALAGDDSSTCPLLIAERWADGESIGASELLKAVAVLDVEDRDLREDHAVLPEAETALAAKDIVGALRRLLGPAYASPVSGLLVQQNRVVAAYRTGRWDEALAGARAVIADHGSDERAADLCELAALVAADIATWQGDERTVRAWQQYLPDQATRCLHPVLHAAVWATRLWATGDAEAALAQGWRTWKAVGPGAFALAIDGHPRPLSRAVARRTLLARLCGIAAVERRREWYPRLLSAADEWCRVARGAEVSYAAETRELARGVLGDGAPDRAALERTVQRVSERGHRVGLSWVLLTAGAASGDPAASWSEAYTIAQELQAPVLRAWLRRLMDEHGVRPPRPRPRASGLTDVQFRIVELVEQGMTNRQIARDLRMSEKTIENHLTRLFVRFGCRNRHGLATARLTARREDLGAGA